MRNGYRPFSNAALTPVPHGVVCARLVAEAVRENARALVREGGLWRVVLPFDNKSPRP